MHNSTQSAELELLMAIFLLKRTHVETLLTSLMKSDNDKSLDHYREDGKLGLSSFLTNIRVLTGKAVYSFILFLSIWCPNQKTRMLQLFWQSWYDSDQCLCSFLGHDLKVQNVVISSI